MIIWYFIYRNGSDVPNKSGRFYVNKKNVPSTKGEICRGKLYCFSLEVKWIVSHPSGLTILKISRFSVVDSTVKWYFCYTFKWRVSNKTCQCNCWLHKYYLGLAIYNLTVITIYLDKNYYMDSNNFFKAYSWNMTSFKMAVDCGLKYDIYKA